MPIERRLASALQWPLGPRDVIGGGAVRACERASAKAQWSRSCVPHLDKCNATRPPGQGARAGSTAHAAQLASCAPTRQRRRPGTLGKPHAQCSGKSRRPTMPWWSDEEAQDVREALPRSAAPHARLAHAPQYGQGRSHHAVWQPVLDRGLRPRESRCPTPRLDHRATRQPAFSRQIAAGPGGEARRSDFGADQPAGQEPCMLVSAA
jgi:hypothetical protein